MEARIAYKPGLPARRVGLLLESQPSDSLLGCVVAIGVLSCDIKA